jgi:hypothetical protein
MSADNVVVCSQQGAPHRIPISAIAWLHRPSPVGPVELYLVDGQMFELEATEGARLWERLDWAESPTLDPDRDG